MEKVTSVRSLNVRVRPSNDTVGIALAMSGTTFRLPSNFRSPSKRFCPMAESVSDWMSAGSSVSISCAIGNRSVWLLASVVGGLPTGVLLEHASNSNPANAENRRPLLMGSISV